MCKGEKILKEIRVLNVLPSLAQANGVASYAMNYYKNFNNKKIRCDFLIVHKRDNAYKDEILKNGDNIFEIYIEDEKNIFNYVKKLKEFFRKNNNYDIIHCNLLNIGFFILYYAKKYGINIRILHAHATKSSDKFIRRIRNNLLTVFVKMEATHLFACSELAGKATFGRNSKFQVINNAVDIEKYRFNNEKRNLLREELNIDDNDYVIGTVGRLNKQKNHKYLLNIFSVFVKENSNSKLVIIGNGPLYENLLELASNLDIKEKVLFLGKIINVYDYYSIFDVFVLTSEYEGLPVVGIEAQAAGLPCVFANTITNEVKISDKVYFNSIKNNNKDWINTLEKLKFIKNDREKENEKIKKSNYEIKKEAMKLQYLYENIVVENN